jgi:hypothetical protein
MSMQMPVPTSIIDWIISGLTCSPNNILPSSRISETCEELAGVRIDDLKLFFNAKGELLE